MLPTVDYRVRVFPVIRLRDKLLIFRRRTTWAAQVDYIGGWEDYGDFPVTDVKQFDSRIEAEEWGIAEARMRQVGTPGEYGPMRIHVGPSVVETPGSTSTKN